MSFVTIESSSLRDVVALNTWPSRFPRDIMWFAAATIQLFWQLWTSWHRRYDITALTATIQLLWWLHSSFDDYDTVVIQLLLRLQYNCFCDCDTAVSTIVIQLFLHLLDMRIWYNVLIWRFEMKIWDENLRWKLEMKIWDENSRWKF